MSLNHNEPAAVASPQAFGPLAPAAEYMVDAAQRTILFWDVMRQRGNQYHEHMAQLAPHVLSYEGEIIIDGRTLQRPVNYASGLSGSPSSCAWRRGRPPSDGRMRLLSPVTNEG